MATNPLKIAPQFAKILKAIPNRTEPPLPSDWLRTEMRERYKVLAWLEVKERSRVLEVGCGAHAITTVPLAFFVGASGSVVAVDRERWRYFREVVKHSGLKNRVSTLRCDARRLPMESRCFDIAIIVHGIRSLRDEGTMTRVLSEMIRVSSNIFVAESLPIARTKAQAAHLQMYNLREKIFEAVQGSKDDVHYLDFETLKRIIETAGGNIIRSGILEPNLPHYLAYVPREYIEKISDPVRRATLLSEWNLASKELEHHGEEHPPVGMILAEG